MDKNKRLATWMPVIIAASIALGIFIGNRFWLLSNGKSRNYISGNKINAVLDVIEEQYVDTVDMKKLVEGTIPKVFSELDPHSVYIPAADAAAVKEDLEGSFSGIGVSFNMELDTILVINVIPGGPSEKAGIKPFDRIVTINDSVYAGNHTNRNKVQKLLRGMKDSTVKLGIKRDDQPDLIELEVTRGDVPVNTVDVAYEAGKGIGYIKVSKFGRTTYNEFITSIAKLKQSNCQSFIIDLRGNTGGYMDAAIKMINEFMPGGRMIVYAEGKAFPRFESFANGTGTCLDNDIIVLTDEISASASEIFAGAIQDNDRGTIVGRRSFGKGLVQQPIEFSDGSAIRLTIARYYTPSGRCIQKPYSKGNDAEYEMDLITRYEHGEFFSADSIKQNKDEVYHTSLGRTVYGGGGIMPDIFVPQDTIGITSYYRMAATRGLLPRFALDYTDKNRTKMQEYDNADALVKFLQKQNLIEKFAQYAESRGLKRRNNLIAKSRTLLNEVLIGNVVYDMLGIESYIEYLNKSDVTVQKALQVLEKGEAFPKAPQQEEE